MALVIWRASRKRLQAMGMEGKTAHQTPGSAVARIRWRTAHHFLTGIQGQKNKANIKVGVWSVAIAPLKFPETNPRSGGAARLAAIARLARRVCVLRELGQTAAASQLEENDFANSVRDLRLAEGADALSAPEVEAIFAREEQRVADAAVLAELLVPQLKGALADLSARSPGPNLTLRRETPAPFSGARVTEPVAGSPAITDMLDAMLAADRADRSKPTDRRIG